MNRFSFKVAMPVLLGLMVVSLGLPSCEKTDDDSGNGSESFWDKSDAFKRQLKGKVHTMYDGNTYTFDESGWLVKIEGLNEQTFQYTNGRLSTYQEKNTYNGQQTIYISRYTYGNHGKYIPQNLYYDLSENSLMKDLVKIETDNGSTSYVLKGDSILCINEYTYDGQTEKDTSVIYYDGGRYPVRMHYFHMYRTITYAQDGKFLTVVQGHFPSPGYEYRRTIQYRNDSPYLLPSSEINQEFYNGKETYSNERTFTYNSHDDLTGITEGIYQEEYSDYVYDAQGNWTERNYRYNNGDSWSAKEKQTRQFTYWE